MVGGWHLVNLSWRGESVGISVDGGRVLLGAPLPVRPMGRGLDISDCRRRIEPSGISFGPIKGAVIDDLVMMRQ